MKKLLTVFKFTLLAALLIGLGFAFLFFRVWQTNERPEMVDNSWSSPEVVLGQTSTLTLTVEAPWHREIESAVPFSHPEFLPPVPDQATVTKGNLGATGMRTWTLSVPFVATDLKSVEGLTASFPVKRSERVSPNFIDAPLPPLTILNPADIPETPNAPDDFLTEEEPPEEPPGEPAPAEKPTRYWPWIVLALLGIPLLVYLLKRSGIIKTTPPWEKALASLSRLDPTTDPVPFYSKLTDILKQYTSDRFRIRGRSKTSAEFISVLKNHPRIPKDHLDDLTAFARLADAVKFADHLPDSAKARTYHDLIRSFVSDTTPEQEEGKKSKAPKVPEPPVSAS